MLLVDSRTAAEKLATMPADADMGLLYRTYSASSKREDGSSEWDDRPVWGSTTGIRTRSGLIGIRGQAFPRDTLFVL